MSLDEAKQVTATFQERAFVPPPRTITDVLAIFEQPSAGRSLTARALTFHADATPPVGATGAVLAQFYYERGKAAMGLGRARQELEDNRAAVQLVNRVGSDDLRGEIFSMAAWAEAGHGNYARAIELMERAAATNRYAPAYPSGLVRLHTIAGDLKAARAAHDEARYRINQGWGKAWAPVHGASNQFMLLEAEGRWAEAEPFIRQSIKAFEDGGLTHQWPQWVDERRGALVRNLIRQGRLVEAEVLARDTAVRTLREWGTGSRVALGAAQGLAGVLLAEGRTAEAVRLLGVTSELRERVGGGGFTLAAMRQTLAEALVADGQWEAALVQFDRVREGLRENAFLYDRVFTTGVYLPLALLKAGRTEEAVTHFARSHEVAKQRFGPRHYDTAERGGLLAVALAATGQKERVLAAFQEAIPVLLPRSRQADEESGTTADREQRRQLILEAYITLLQELRGTPLERTLPVDPVAEAFRLADAARGQQVQRALGASTARAAARDPGLADLVRREQDARKQISALYGLLANALSAPTGQQKPDALRDLRDQIDRLRDARAALAEELERRFPEYVALIDPRPVPVAQAQALLRPGEALIVFYVAPDRTFVWAVPPQGPLAFAAAPVGEAELRRSVAGLRRALDPRAATLGDIPDFDVEAAHALFRSLLLPVRAGWQSARSLLVVAHGPLGQLPLALLPTGPGAPGPEAELLFARYRTVPWLARTHAVTVLPSVAALGSLRALPGGAPTRRPFVGFGDPIFSAEQVTAPPRARAAAGAEVGTRGMPVALRSSPEVQAATSAQPGMLPRLPETADEIREIAVALQADLTTEVFLGRDANEETLRSQNLAGYRVLAFATHGLVPGDLDGLYQPALALSAPAVAGVEGDGLLTMEEILTLRLDADWVVLSACNTASAEGAGAEAVSGLGRAFFYAGARALLVSQWPVETTSARALTTELFRRQQADPRLSRAAALQQTMTWLIDSQVFVDPRSQRAVFSYAHPIFWAPFALVGDSGGP
jgi:CHAT domain-containing protein